MMTDKSDKYQSTLSWFAKNAEIYRSTRSRALEIICDKVCDVLEVERFGVWLYTVNGDAIFEEMTYVKNGAPTSGRVIQRTESPIYFKRIDQERVMVSTNAQTDPDIVEFMHSCLIPLNIYALLDAPIFSDGRMIGIICIESTRGPRQWDKLDESFAAAIADLVGRLIEAEKRHAYEKELKHRIDYLENDLRKKLEDLREAKLSLDLALEGAQAGKWDWDIVTGKLILNKTWFTRLGYEYNEIPQDISSFRTVIHPEDIDKVFEAIDQHLKGKTIFYECRYRMVTKTGEIQWCIDRGCVTKRSMEGQPLRATGVNINITPIIQLEQSLLLSAQQLKAMIRSLPAPVAMFDRNFNYIAFSSRWEQEWNRFGKIDEGTSLKENEGFREQWFQTMQEAMSGKTISQDEDLVNVTSEVQLWLRWIVQPWKHSNGDIGGVVIMAENITHRKEAEMRITQSSKLSALGEMAGGIAHEINNPLSIIKGYIDLLKRHSSRKSLSQDLMLQYIDKMDVTVGRISRIVNGMRRFSRESSMDEKVKYSLNKVIEETLDICLERINNNGTALQVEPFQGEAIVLCRPIELSQVLLNLINNAFQAISIFSHPWIHINCRELVDRYEIEVVDCGPGIPSYIRQKLFQPFFTTKDIGVGTGLGLSISRGIIEEHQGKLYYQDEAQNTTFVIELPKLVKEDEKAP